MKTTIQTEYVRLKSELTKVIEDSTVNSLTAYRTTLLCNCKERNRRQGIIIVQGDRIIAQVIRCKSCEKGGRP